MTAAKLMHQTKVMILLSLNAIVVLIVGVMIFSAINLNGGIELKVVSERSDMVTDSLEAVGLISPGVDQFEATVVAASENDGKVLGAASGSSASSGEAQSSGEISYSTTQGSSAGARQLWGATTMTIYQTADVDICVDSNVTDITRAEDMYWQTTNEAVIRSFSKPRTALGYNAATCVTPMISGTGSVKIIAGTYDGSRRDEITVTVVAPPVEQWKQDVLTLVNQERAKVGVAPVSWGNTCTEAANIRVREIMTSYSHTRPDGSIWSTLCPGPDTGGKKGENLNAGGLAVSPATAVATWMASPEHRQNILDPEFKYLAVGFVFDMNAPYRTYWSQFFSTY